MIGQFDNVDLGIEPRQAGEAQDEQIAAIERRGADDPVEMLLGAAVEQPEILPHDGTLYGASTTRIDSAAHVVPPPQARGELKALSPLRKHRA